MEEKADALSEVAPAMSEVSKQTTSQIKTAKPGKNPGRVVARKKLAGRNRLVREAKENKRRRQPPQSKTGLHHMHGKRQRQTQGLIDFCYRKPGCFCSGR